jgi:ribosomal protein L44E
VRHQQDTGHTQGYIHPREAAAINGTEIQEGTAGTPTVAVCPPPHTHTLHTAPEARKRPEYMSRLASRPSTQSSAGGGAADEFKQKQTARVPTSSRCWLACRSRIGSNRCHQAGQLRRLKGVQLTARLWRRGWLGVHQGLVSSRVGEEGVQQVRV